MYSCPGSGITGNLRIYVKAGHGISRNSKHGTYYYVEIKAIDDNRVYTVLKTLNLQSEQSSSWYQWIDFGKQHSWQYFQMSIWTSDLVSEKQLTDKQTFSVSPGYHKSL